MRVKERTSELAESVEALREEITARKRAEEALRKRTAELSRSNEQLAAMNEELDAFVYAASHDLQEPIRHLVSYSSLLREDIGEDLPEEAATDLFYISEAAKRMQTLVQDLLALSRAGRAAMRREQVCLDDCVAEALEALRRAVEETGASIERVPLPEVTGDATLLIQLYQNLIGNALKFRSEQRPVVTLTAEKGSEGWTLGVRDNGIGIAPQYAEQVFTPFRRLHGRTEYEGSGVGLAICRRNVERHGGRIWVESEPGQGAHFKFTIPAADIGQEEL